MRMSLKILRCVKTSDQTFILNGLEEWKRVIYVLNQYFEYIKTYT